MTGPLQDAFALNGQAGADAIASPRTARNTTSGDSSDPLVCTAANSHADTASAAHRIPAAANAAPTEAAASASRVPPAGSSGTGSGDSAPARPVKNARTRGECSRNRPSRSRTVPSGTPVSSEIRTGSCPRAARTIMSPITAVESHRRDSSRAGSSTCVAPHDLHRPRRGRASATAGSRPASTSGSRPGSRPRASNTARKAAQP